MKRFNAEHWPYNYYSYTTNKRMYLLITYIYNNIWDLFQANNISILEDFFFFFQYHSILDWKTVILLYCTIDTHPINNDFVTSIRYYLT
jgi:hypothetical protein